MDQIPSSPQSLPLLELIPASLSEMQRRLAWLALLFMLIALGTLLYASSMPKQYHASTTILITEDNIIRELMDGRAVATRVGDRATIAGEVIFSRKVMDQVLSAAGWEPADLARGERDRLAQSVESRTSIHSPSDNLIQIAYWDRDPDRARTVTASFAELFIAESAEAKRRESREAYEFIAAQVAQYHSRLIDAELSLKQFREVSEDAQPGTGSEVSGRVAELRRDLETWRMQQEDLHSRRLALQGQLGELGSESQLDSYQNELLQQIARLQTRLDNQLLDLTPRHPDVVRSRHQIEALREELAASADRLGREETRGRHLDSPINEELVRVLAEVRRDIAGLEARIRAGETLLARELQRGRRVADSDMELSELSRDQEVNQAIYADLLNRQENARLSMRLDETGHGPTFSIHEPAVEPAHASGPRFIHMASGGLVAAVALPLGLIVVLVRLDPRVRSPEGLERTADLPLLAAVPRYWSASDRKQWRMRVRLAVLALVVTLLAFAGAAWWRLVVIA